MAKKPKIQTRKPPTAEALSQFVAGSQPSARATKSTNYTRKTGAKAGENLRRGVAPFAERPVTSPACPPALRLREDAVMQTNGSKIDWALWSRIDTARLCDLTALLSDINPKTLTLRAPRMGWNAVTVELPNASSAQAREQFDLVFRLGSSAMESGGLKCLGIRNVSYPAANVVRVDEFVRWADAKQLVIPPELHHHLNGALGLSRTKDAIDEVRTWASIIEIAKGNVAGKRGER